MTSFARLKNALVAGYRDRRQVSVVVATVVFLAGTWAIAAYRLDTEREFGEKSARIRQENLAAIIAENLTQLVDRGSLLAATAAKRADGDSNVRQGLSAALPLSDRAFLRVAYYDGQLRETFATAPMPRNTALDAALHAAFEGFARDRRGEIFIAPPSPAIEQAWEVPLLYPVAGDDGSPRGILLAVLDLGYLLNLYRDIDIGETGAIEVLDNRGTLVARARRGGLEVVAGSLPLGGPPPPETNGTVTLAQERDGNRYQVSVRRLQRYPFVIAVSHETREQLTEYRASRGRFLAMLFTLSAAVLLACVWILLSLRKADRLYARLAQADSEKRQLIVQLEDEKRRAFDLASHDHLTGLPNRRMFAELGASHLSRARRSRLHYGLLYVDLDRFKGINDTLGHHIGDLLLQTVASRLRSVLRDSDVIARLGGDEFVILLTGMEQRDDMARIADKVVEVVSRPCTNLEGHDIQVSPSIGIAVFPRDGHDIATLSRHADAAMYESKRAGRGKYTFYDPALNPTSERLFELEQGLPRAIAEDELLLYFQPKVRLADYRITGFEVLLRWQHPDHGLIHPNEFIPLAEQAGLTSALGDWVIAASCRQLAEWQAQRLPLVPLAINLAARQLADPELPGRIAATLAAHGLSPRLLEVEITESSLLESVEMAGRVLRELENLGVTIALDDFGNGYSSLGYIRTLPIHTIKIDRSFINDIRNSPDDRVIVASIVTLAHNLKLRTVAEGVELLEQLIHLKTVGCDEVQGFYLCRPAPAAAARQFLIDGLPHLS